MEQPITQISFDEWKDLYAPRMSKIRRSAVRDLFSAISRPGVIGLSGGSPDISSLPLDELAQCAKNVVDKEGLQALQYGSSGGRPQMLKVVQRIISEQNIEASRDEIILTSGSQQALDFLGRIFLEPGDTVVVEGPTYLGALQAFSAQEPQHLVIPLDEEGMQVDVLADKLRKWQGKLPKFIYTIPNFQNPSGCTMSYERRKQLLEVAHTYNIPIVEDDPYGLVRFEGTHIASLKSMDPNVIYLGTVSKIFAPGLRMAWCVAPRPFIERMNLCEQGAGLCVSAFAQAMCEQYFTTVDWHEVLHHTRALYKRRRDALIGALEEYFPHEASWTHPQGGLFVWVTLPQYFNTEQMMGAALAAGVAYVPGTNCYPNGDGASSMRLAFSYESEEKLREGVKRLAHVIEKRLELYRAFMAAGALSRPVSTQPSKPQSSAMQPSKAQHSDLQRGAPGHGDSQPTNS